MYITPDFAHVVYTLIRFMPNSIPIWEALKWLLKYMKATFEVDLMFNSI